MMISGCRVYSGVGPGQIVCIVHRLLFPADTLARLKRPN